jgi:hypothetical protein
MSSPYNNQWVLGRPRRRGRGRVALSDALRPASDRSSPQRQERNERRDRRGSHDSGAPRSNGHRVHLPRGFDPAFPGGMTRKPPRWIDRDI